MTERPRRRIPRRDINGIFLLDKPAGISSNAALQRVKRLFGARKAGHTGNLDVLATGLLPICFGEATKVCAFLLDADKTYAADFRLGVVTTTGDSEGEVVRRHTPVTVDLASARQAAAGFTGEIQQIPPMYSALKRNGQPLYKLARQGIEVERAPRTVMIHRFDVTSVVEEVMGVEVTCSKGTYIRTLAEDVGEALGCGAHVSSLRRLHAGPYSLANARTLEQIEALVRPADPYGALDRLLLPMDTALVSLPDLELTDESAFAITRGQAVRVPDSPGAGLVRLYRPEREFIGVGTVLDDGRIAPRRLMR
jgi:tRNA pseudouridine55 synthase